MRERRSSDLRPGQRQGRKAMRRRGETAALHSAGGALPVSNRLRGLAPTNTAIRRMPTRPAMRAGCAGRSRIRSSQGGGFEKEASAPAGMTGALAVCSGRSSCRGTSGVIVARFYRNPRATFRGRLRRGCAWAVCVACQRPGPPAARSSRRNARRSLRTPARSRICASVTPGCATAPLSLRCRRSRSISAAMRSRLAP